MNVVTVMLVWDKLAHVWGDKLSHKDTIKYGIKVSMSKYFAHWKISTDNYKRLTALFTD